MRKFVNNQDIIDMFKNVEKLKKDSSVSEEKRESEIKSIHNIIISRLSTLVYDQASKYIKMPNYDDLVQEGFVGLIKAVKRYDYNLFPNIIVYSEKWIKHHIKRAASRFDVVYCPNKKRVIYASPSEVGKEEEVEDTPEEMFFAKETGQKIEEVLNKFPDRDKEIVKRIFGLGEYNRQTLREIGAFYDLTHERVRQIKNEVISKLRKNKCLGELY